MKLLFRTDGNSDIGIGHVMRCLSIADAANQIGDDVVFVMADDSLSHLVKQHGYRCFILHTEYNFLDSEIDLLQRVICDETPNLVIVDSYFVTDNYLRSVKKCVKVGYIDDSQNRTYDVDVIINYNIYATQIAYSQLYNSDNKNNCNTSFIVGPEYAPLRDMFVHTNGKSVNDCIKHIMIAAGGSDPEHMLKMFVDYIIEHNDILKRYNFHIVAGRFEPDIDYINRIALDNKNIFVHYDVERIVDLMCQMDLCISETGTMLYELSACGVPTICYDLEDNQPVISRTFCERRMAVYIGDIRRKDISLENVFDKLLYLDKKIDERKTISENMRNVVNGRGAERIVKRLHALI